MSDKQTVIVVDDDNGSRSIARTILSTGGYEVVTFTNGPDALEKMPELSPSIVILDIMMPQMSGYDVLVRMRQKPETQNIPVIFLTAKDEPDDMLTGYKDYCVDYYITKPFTPSQLLTGVRLAIGESTEEDIVAPKKVAKEVK